MHPHSTVNRGLLVVCIAGFAALSTGLARPAGTAPAPQRAIYAVEAAIDPPLALPAGTYWLDWQSSGTLASGPWVVPVTIPGSTGAPAANARFFNGTSWSNLRDSGTQAAQDLTFIIRGTGGSAPAPCYANCDHSTAVPFLNVGDFICFGTIFAAGNSAANCDGSTIPPVLNVSDFICFQTRFAAGCSAP